MTTTKTTVTTVAQGISDRFYDDGWRWVSDDGDSLIEVCESLASEKSTLRREGRGSADDIHRYVFADGSVITAMSDAWDLGCTGCYGWPASGEHDDDCTMVAK